MKDQWDGLPTDAFSSQTCFGVVLTDSNRKLDLEHRYLLIGSAFLMVRIDNTFFHIFDVACI